ncbi:hypothetical protein OK016_27065 [Vibrio chagasii]|nr:hypothetical protein [Vibrio chagasii]
MLRNSVDVYTDIAPDATCDNINSAQLSLRIARMQTLFCQSVAVVAIDASKA